MFFKKDKSLIEFYNLDNWIKESFSKNEIQIIKNKAPHIFDSKAPYNKSSALVSHLSNALSFINTKENKDICQKFVNKIESEISTLSVEDRYFSYIEVMKFYYKNDFIEEAEKVCDTVIAFSEEALKSILNNEMMNNIAPSNPFYEQKAIILKKRKEWQEIINLCNKGKSEGWSNDFNKRIEEAQKHL